MFREFSDNNRSEEFLNEFRQKMADQTASNIEERQNELRRSRGVFIGTLAGLVLAGMIGGFILAPRYNRDFADDIPLIKAPEGDVKYAPEDRGGMEIAGKDKSVYEVLNNSQNDEVVENVLPAPEEPRLPEVVPVEENYTPVTIDDIIQNTGEEIINNATKVLTTNAQNAPDIAENDAQVSVAEYSESIAEINPSSREKMDEIKAQVNNKLKGLQDEKAEKIEELENTASTFRSDPAPVLSAQTTKDVAASGDWQIQIMSAKNREGIEKSWKDLQSKYSFFADLSHEIEKADLGASGIYYRLKAGAFASKEDAEKVCNQYKAQKGSCLVKKK